MKILKISGKNLASLAGEFTVDFEREPLASSGLFAISGPTGAGKSTLLDALCLALYDATPRLLKVAGRGNALPDVGKETVSAQDTRTLLRRGSAEGYAEVDFVGNDGAAYRARWSVRRSRTRAEGSLQATAMSLQQLPALQPIGGTKTEVKIEIERRIGLSFEQFTRAVLLAQNEFSTFLKTEDNERGELLETLTGSTIYSDLSIRAFERYKKEQAALQRLTEKLADRKPLGADERAALDGESATADAAVAALDGRKTALEQHLRWHQDGEMLRDSETLARQAVQASALEAEAAAGRRAALAQLEAVQAARPLHDDTARLEADLALGRAALADSERDAAQARLTQKAMAAAQQLGAEHLLQAEQARREAAPRLDQAKALDARIDALRPAHRQAQLASAAADQGDDGARAALEQERARQAQLAAAHELGAAWLARHQQWQALAQSWPRWDLLFVQAEQAAAQAATLARDLARARRDASAGRDDEASHAAGAQAAAQAVQALEAQRLQAAVAVGAFDGDALQERRRQLECRRDALVGAEKTWTELSGKQARRAHLQAQATQLRLSRLASEATLAQDQARAEGLTAALEQAGRSLQAAEAACAASVKTLRATLRDEQPCPVCGALEHPYRHEDGALQAMLSGLRDEVARCRRLSEENIGQQASERTVMTGCAAQLGAAEQELRALDEAIAAIAPRWEQQAAALAPPAEDEREAWFEAQTRAIQADLHEVEGRELALRQAGAARDRAQLARDEAASLHARLTAAAAAAQTRLAQLSAQLVALDERRAAQAMQLAALLDELDGAFQHAEFDSGDWKESWHGAPVGFHAARQEESRQWLAQRAAHEERGAALATVNVELRAAQAVLAKAGQDAHAARAAFATLAATLKTMREERQVLWEGRAVADIEAGLHAAVELAQAEQTARQDASRQAEQTRARLDEALAQVLRRLAALGAASVEAQARLADWLRQFQRERPDAAPPDLERLRALLATPTAALAAENAALRALDERTAAAATVLRERQAQRERQRALRPPDLEGADNVANALDDAPAQALTDALASLAIERRGAHAHATAQQLAIAQDQARRHDAQAMLAEIGLQEEIERRWARMHELIGSADGKKFRNYAQQFTLDVLLGYANAHLNQLARRYQLERIDNPANPSLGLMVRDQDMGGELRSVHSLSGGESFLVSLALALGLASLSSNRVRVESLFIDEGFGSLDSDTLRVAMDALDGLQSMGRKVGVISHVQEMTERISTRILVRPTAGGRSHVSVQGQA